MPSKKKDDDNEAFVELMTRYQGHLYGYALSLTADPEAANDLLQETNVVLWENWREFEPGTNFKAWSFRVAHFQFMALRQRRLRDRLYFGDGLVTAIAVEAKELDETYEQRVASLASCLEQLRPRWREIIRLRYSEGLAVQGMATKIGLSANAISQLLFRARRSLIECVKRAQAKESST
ncbi:MAG: sigma-70 family RNA polymerase sigma factor [Planctomycetes bacterium]|nr:sigma-70 family RNA polymerase sigma factor [Planctomycetota bacterium]